MRLTFRDGLATVFVAAAAAVYIPWVTGSAAMLAMLTASMAGLWVIATARHALAAGTGSLSRRPTKSV